MFVTLTCRNRTKSRLPLRRLEVGNSHHKRHAASIYGKESDSFKRRLGSNDSKKKKKTPYGQPILVYEKDVNNSTSIPKGKHETIIHLNETKRSQFGWNIRILFGVNQYDVIGKIYNNLHLTIGKTKLKNVFIRNPNKVSKPPHAEHYRRLNI